MEKPTQTQTRNLSRQRKRYMKPVIEQVSLALEEAVLGTGCKTDAVSGPDGSTCIINFTNCAAPGS